MPTWVVYPALKGVEGRAFVAERMTVSADGTLMFEVTADGRAVIKHVVPGHAYAYVVAADQLSDDSRPVNPATA